MKITRVSGRQILDSRGNPTVEAEVCTKNAIGRAAVPAGASTGKHEAVELRDGRKEFLGRGVLTAVQNINTIIARRLVGKECARQEELDHLLAAIDGTPNKGRLGANAILGVSMAACRAAGNSRLYAYIGRLAGNREFVLPVPFCNVINGGKHAGNSLPLQEFMIAPVGAKRFSEGMRMVAETYHLLKGIIQKRYGRQAANVGDEGGFAPPLENAGQALNLLVKAIEEAGYGSEMKIAIDAAASSFYSRGIYALQRQYSAELLSGYYLDLVKKYPIISLEDPFAEDDSDAFQRFMRKAGDLQVVGDDLLVTDPARIRMAIEGKLCNALLLKLNQIGTVSEALQAAQLAMKGGWKVMVSHRSGETEDTFIADLAVGIGCGQIKAGAPCRGERTAKYNRLLQIEEELGKKAKYARL
ncbi:MAG TPA: phosphopyruvate hydratase [Candidatus Nanoarchaeia archaeon]|nr:phosphopyruvate hydratase [Candidatus Nanoarchaeia archaeon]